MCTKAGGVEVTLPWHPLIAVGQGPPQARDAPSSASSPAQSLSSWGHTNHPESDDFGLCHVPISSPTGQMNRSVVWHTIFQTCGSRWPWDSHRHVPPLIMQVSVWLHLVAQAVVSLQGWGQSPSLCALGGSVLHPPTSQTIPTPTRIPHWPRCAHHSWDRRCPAHSRAHQLGPFHPGGLGLRVAAPAQLHTGKLTRASPSSSLCFQALPRLSKRHPR